MTTNDATLSSRRVGCSGDAGYGVGRPWRCHGLPWRRRRWWRRFLDGLQGFRRGRSFLHNDFDLLGLARDDTELVRVAFAVVAGDNGVVAGCENMRGERAGILLHHIAGRSEDAPFGVSKCLTSRALHELESDRRGGMLDRCL